MDINLLLFLLFIGSPISIFIHELGHAVAAISLKANQITISIGSGQALFTIRIYHITVIINRVYFIGGMTKYKRTKGFTSKELIWLTILGPVFNGVTACIIFTLLAILSNTYLQLLFLFNLWLALANLLPFRIKDKQTDGYTIIQLLRERY